MKKITTICLATILLHSFSILNAQSLYSETPRQASFTQFTSAGEIFTPRYTTSIGAVDLKKTSGGVQLNWQVSDLNNVSYFDIQRSTDNKQFTTIGYVGVNSKGVYRFTDREPGTGPTYFRVKGVDQDGTVNYSRVVSTGTEQSSAILFAYPMPAQNEITIQHALVTTKGIISVHTQEGNLVMSVTPAMGAMQTSLDLSYLKSGVYLLRFDDGAGKVESMRIVKQ